MKVLNRPAQWGRMSWKTPMSAFHCLVDVFAAHSLQLEWRAATGSRLSLPRLPVGFRISLQFNRAGSHCSVGVHWPIGDIYENNGSRS